MLLHHRGSVEITSLRIMENKMKKLMTVLSLTTAAFLVAGCEYEAPLTTEHSISIDPAILGLWTPVPKQGKDPNPDNRMLILRYSDTEYLIRSPTGKDGIYYRGYPIDIEGVSCVQLEVIGVEEAPIESDEKELFHIASYDFKNGFLEISLLNTDLVDKHLKDTDTLRKAFLENKNNKELFRNQNRYRSCVVVHK
jgi:hypothetical protein